MNKLKKFGPSRTAPCGVLRWTIVTILLVASTALLGCHKKAAVQTDDSESEIPDTYSNTGSETEEPMNWETDNEELLTTIVIENTTSETIFILSRRSSVSDSAPRVIMCMDDHGEDCWLMAVPCRPDCASVSIDEPCFSVCEDYSAVLPIDAHSSIEIEWNNKLHVEQEYCSDGGACSYPIVREGVFEFSVAYTNSYECLTEPCVADADNFIWGAVYSGYIHYKELHVYLPTAEDIVLTIDEYIDE